MIISQLFGVRAQQWQWKKRKSLLFPASIPLGNHVKWGQIYAVIPTDIAFKESSRFISLRTIFQIYQHISLFWACTMSCSLPCICFSIPPLLQNLSCTIWFPHIWSCINYLEKALWHFCRIFTTFIQKCSCFCEAETQLWVKHDSQVKSDVVAQLMHADLLHPSSV